MADVGRELHDIVQVSNLSGDVLVRCCRQDEGQCLCGLEVAPKF